MNIAQTEKDLKTLWREATADTPLPSDAVLERIHHEAAARTRRCRETVVVLPFRRLPRFAAAYAVAAAAVILAAGLLTHTVLRPGTGDAADGNLDARIADVLSDIDMSLLAVLDSLAENGNPPDVERDALALQLILMEDS